MSTQLLKMLMTATKEMPDDEYNATEVKVRSMLIEQCVTTPSSLALNEDSAAHCYTPEDGWLYIGSHECPEHDMTDGASIDLIAFGPDPAKPDDPDCNDYLTWHFKNVYQEDLIAEVSYCPYCGLDLIDLVTNHLD